MDDDHNSANAIQQSLDYQNAQMRMQCMHLAAGVLDRGSSAKDFVATAQQFYDFVVNGKKGESE